MKSNNIFSQLGAFAAECVQCYRDAYKFASGRWAIEEKQHEEMLFFNESRLIDNGFVSNVARAKGLEAKLYKDAMNDKPTEDIIAALQLFQEQLEAEERRERAIARKKERNWTKTVDAVSQLIIFGALAFLAFQFTDTACFKLKRNSAYCQKIEQVHQYFWGETNIPRIF